MCGIWAVSGTLTTHPNIAKYLEKLKARGPEHSTIHYIGNIILGFTRLAINGLTPAGNQPFLVDNKIYTICNGEIYNYKELVKRHNLELVEGTSDCAVIPHLYKKLDIKNLCRTLDGVFAFVIVDLEKSQIVVARDPYGVRPLFQAQYSDGSIVWSSEIKAIPPNYISIMTFKPGTYSIFDMKTNRQESYQYHSIPYLKIAEWNTSLSRSEAKNALRNAVYLAVKKRLLSDRPIGALLSGGLDSSLVAAIAARELAKDGKKLHTFSIGMPGSTDLKYAALVAKHINSEHHEILVKQENFLNAIPNVIEAIESYDITTVRASVGNYLVGKYIKENTDIKVVFNGDGSDEIGGGYIYFYNAPNDEEFESESERLLEEIHYFDVLRSDRCISCHGLEARTPFLDKSVVATWRQMSTDFRRPKKTNSEGRGLHMEKQILREAFENDNLLPWDVLWRKKEAFSDGVSATDDSWYLKCKEYAEKTLSSFEVESNCHNPPKTAEAYWYRSLFEKYYGTMAAKLIPHMWMPRWTTATDPSARTLKELY